MRIFLWHDDFTDLMLLAKLARLSCLRKKGDSQWCQIILMCKFIGITQSGAIVLYFCSELLWVHAACGLLRNSGRITSMLPNVVFYYDSLYPYRGLC